MNKAYVYELLPNNKQQEIINKTTGCSRFIYNQYLAIKKDIYELLGISINKKQCYLLYNDIIKAAYPFLKEVDSLALCNSEINLDRAFSNFYRDKEVGYPKFKNKHKAKLRYTTNNQRGSIRVIDDKHIKLPKLGIVSINLHRSIPSDFTIKSATISKNRSSNKYSISILLESEEKEIIKVKPTKVLGLDYSSTHLYVDSDNNTCNYNRYYRANETKLAKEERKLSKCKLGSNNYYKQKIKKNKVDSKIANSRRDFLHKESKRLADTYDVIVVEDINLQNISQCLSLGKSTNDNGFGMFRNFLEYKLNDRGKYFIKVNKFFPSSKLCSNCGYKKDKLLLSERTYTCSNCHTIIDRDYNAALNIKYEGMRLLNLV